MPAHAPYRNPVREFAEWAAGPVLRLAVLVGRPVLRVLTHRGRRMGHWMVEFGTDVFWTEPSTEDSLLPPRYGPQWAVIFLAGLLLTWSLTLLALAVFT